jgi:hypothetical protein
MNDDLGAELAEAIAESLQGQPVPHVPLNIAEQGLRKLLQDAGAEFYLRPLPALVHGPGFEVGGKIKVGENRREFRYCIAYCPIQDTSYVADREAGLHILDVAKMDEFTKVTIQFDQGLRTLLPHEPYLFDLRQTTRKTE